jgi:hypothetical protein
MSACDLDTSLAPRVELDVVVQPSQDTFQTNDDTTIELTEARIAIDTIEFTTEGEMHARAGILPALHDLVVPTAYAHPGHSAGGEVIGELAGRFVLDCLATEQTLGLATMLTSEYTGANFTFAVADASDGLDAADPLIGHTFVLAGTATRGDVEVEFVAYVDQDEDREIIGLPLSFSPNEDSTERLGIQFDPVDPVEGDTIFDGIDFVGLDEDEDGFVELSADDHPEAWALLRRALQEHDHYAVEVLP